MSMRIGTVKLMRQHLSPLNSGEEQMLEQNELFQIKPQGNCHQPEESGTSYLWLCHYKL